MKKWAVRTVKVMAASLVLVSGLSALALWVGNRDVAPVSMAERQLAFQRSLAWVRAHEGDMFREDNVALWWFIQTAAERTGDEYLQALMTRYMAALRQDGAPTLPWRRMLDPKAEVTLNAVPIQSLEPYQRFFYHGLTCQPVELGDGDTSVFLKNKACHPAFTEVWLKDPACTTHHLVGAMLLHRTGCMPQTELAALEKDLLADIESQLRWDVIVKDAYLQRLMMLMWQGQPGQVKPVWLKRVLMAQQADGGWIGGRQFPELPEWAQPWVLRSRLAAWFPSRFHASSGFDFHASAQGLLITALAVTETQK